MLKSILSRGLVRYLTKNLHRYADSSKITRQIQCGVCLENPRHTSKSNNDTSPAISSKYQVINEKNSPVIQNTYDEIHNEYTYPILSDEYDGINLNRGKTGVFDIEDLVELLQRENSKNIFVASVPPQINYVDYICVVSGRSKRHIHALAEFVKKVYKKKRYDSDPVPRLEGKESNEWVALDLGNIALHIFSDETRKMYDLETLWAVGAEYDDKTNKKDVIEILENYSDFLKDLKPLS